MGGSDIAAGLGVVATVIVGGLLAWAGSAGSAEVGSLPVFVLGTALAFVINWLAFVPAFRAQTEKFYDLTGSLTYLSVVVLGLALSGNLDARAIIAALMVAAWATRLGSFLFRRIRKDGKDGRFDSIKPHFWRFLRAWSLQGLWVTATLAAALAIITSETREALGIVGIVGIIIWVIGFAIEVTADQQKSAFRADPVNDGRFITTGLWAWSRHPNYFGEITLWIGMAVLAVPILSGWRWVMLISPVFVFLLLTRISGVPLLEYRAKKRWGDEPAYQKYVASTPPLLLRPPRQPGASPG